MPTPRATTYYKLPRRLRDALDQIAIDLRHDENWTLAEIAILFGVSQERMRQRIVAAEQRFERAKRWEALKKQLT